MPVYALVVCVKHRPGPAHARPSGHHAQAVRFAVVCHYINNDTPRQKRRQTARPLPPFSVRKGPWYFKYHASNPTRPSILIFFQLCIGCWPDKPQRQVKHNVAAPRRMSGHQSALHSHIKEPMPDIWAYCHFPPAYHTYPLQQLGSKQKRKERPNTAIF